MANAAKLTLGPVLYHWPETDWRDFYFRIADEASVDVVYVGEAVCSKRDPFTFKHLDEVIARLQKSGKEVVRTSLALVMSNRERNGVKAICSDDATAVEANDLSAISALKGQPHVIGPFINTYNEGAAAWFASNGASRIVLPNELSGDAIKAIAAAKPLPEIEVQVFGRLPLALSARCYSARAHDRTKITCEFICGENPDGMDVNTMDGDPFLAVNGIQTMSHTVASLLGEVAEMADAGITHFRLWPHHIDMVQVARLFDAVLTGETGPKDAEKELSALVPFAPLANGFWYSAPGVAQMGA